MQTMSSYGLALGYGDVGAYTHAVVIAFRKGWQRSKDQQEQRNERRRRMVQLWHEEPRGQCTAVVLEVEVSSEFTALPGGCTEGISARRCYP